MTILRRNCGMNDENSSNCAPVHYPARSVRTCQAIIGQLPANSPNRANDQQLLGGTLAAASNAPADIPGIAPDGSEIQK